LIREFFDVLRMGSAGDEQGISGRDDDEILHTEQSHMLAGLGED
jgi:hypothetical protein